MRFLSPPRAKSHLVSRLQITPLWYPGNIHLSCVWIPDEFRNCMQERVNYLPPCNEFLSVSSASHCNKNAMHDSGTGSSVWTWGRTSSLWGWRSTGTGCRGRLWSLLLWRYSRAAWTRSCAACCRWPCFSRRVGLDDPQRSPPTPTILWFCDSILRF